MKAYTYRIIVLLTMMIAGCSPTAAADPTEVPITQEPTISITAAPTLMAQPTELATISLQPTLTADLPTPAPQPSAAPSNQYVVQFVPLNDTLNVRSGAGVENEVVAELVNGDRVIATGEDQDNWMPIRSVDFPTIEGWVSASYLVADDPAAFCADPRPLEIIDEVREAVRSKDSARIAALINPLTGLSLGGLNWSKTIRIYPPVFDDFFTNTIEYDWGNDLYSEQPITGTQRDFITPLLEENLLPINVDILCHDSHDTLMPRGIYPGGGQGMESLPFYSVQRPGAEGHELEWGAWAFGFVPNGSINLDDMQLVYLSYYTWTP